MRHVTAFDIGVAPAGGQPPAGAAGRVAGARVYLQSPSRRAFVAEVAAPLCRGLRRHEAADHVHLSSGWRFGSHLDLRAESATTTPIDWADVARCLAAGARRHHAGAAESDAAYLKTATLLGRIEEVPPPYLPRRPHGATELLSAESGRLATLQQVGKAHLLAPLLETAAAGSDGALLARVAEAFLALADSHPHGVRFGTFSLRSHAEAFFQWAGPAADYRSMFDDRMGKDHAVLELLVRRVQDGALSSGAAAWARAFGACQQDFAGQVTDDDLARHRAAEEPPSAARGRSAFHQAVDASGVIDRSPPWFAGFRLTINLFYQLLPALDVSPVQRFYLCHAIAETVDAVYRESWQSRLASVASLMAAAR